jgi:hypothetical protein
VGASPGYRSGAGGQHHVFGTRCDDEEDKSRVEEPVVECMDCSDEWRGDNGAGVDREQASGQRAGGWRDRAAEVKGRNAWTSGVGAS